MGLNRCVLQGRLVADPELRTTTSGVSVANLRIAVERNYKDADGNKEADFFTCTAWRGTADFVQKYFHKGELIIIDGKLQNSSYTDKDGNNRVVTQINVDSVFFCGGGNRNNGEQRPGGHTEQTNTYETAVVSDPFKDISGEEDGDLPF